MGVYLSEPETSKNVQTGVKGDLRFVSGEMQGTIIDIQGGERIWRTPQSTSLTLEMAMHFLPYLMVTEVSFYLFRSLSQSICGRYLCQNHERYRRIQQKRLC